MTEYRNQYGDVPVLHLASASPRRVVLLQQLGLSFTAAGVDIDESANAAEPAQELVRRLAIEKAQAGAAAVAAPVLGADTVVVFDNQVFGKPQSAGEAAGMLQRLAGRSHRVLTAVAALHRDELNVTMSTTLVRFRDISADDARRYWQTGEPRGKAGGYAIQGYGGVFVEAIEGSYSGVVGLPVYETVLLLEKIGVDVLAIAARTE